MEFGFYAVHRGTNLVCVVERAQWNFPSTIRRVGKAGRKGSGSREYFPTLKVGNTHDSRILLPVFLPLLRECHSAPFPRTLHVLNVHGAESVPRNVHRTG